LQHASSSVSSPSRDSGSSSRSEPFDPRDLPITNNLTLDVFTHIGINDQEVAELLIEKINVTGMIGEATRKKLQLLGLLSDVKNNSVELVYPPPGSGGPDSEKVTPETEVQVLKQLATLLHEHQAGVPGGALSKVIKLMDQGNETGFALALKVTAR
jgi:hypothetical protein